MRAEWLHADELKHLLAALMPPNRLVLEISLATGLRLSDVLELRTEKLRAAKDCRYTLRELKTGKTRRVYIPAELRERALMMAGKIYVFENRRRREAHRTRQAVYKDLIRVAAMWRIKPHVSPHSARKAWAVEEYHKTGDLKRVQKLLQHESEAVTMIYAMADQLVKRRRPPASRKPGQSPQPHK